MPMGDGLRRLSELVERIESEFEVETVALSRADDGLAVDLTIHVPVDDGTVDSAVDDAVDFGGVTVADGASPPMAGDEESDPRDRTIPGEDSPSVRDAPAPEVDGEESPGDGDEESPRDHGGRQAPGEVAESSDGDGSDDEATVPAGADDGRADDTSGTGTHTDGPVQCRVEGCGETFGTTHGMKIHATKVHGSEERPPHRDPDRLAEVYEAHDTFGEMTAALDSDVTPQTVRRNMTSLGIHDPGGDRTDAVDDGTDPATDDGTDPATDDTDADRDGPGPDDGASDVPPDGGERAGGGGGSDVAGDGPAVDGDDPSSRDGDPSSRNSSSSRDGGSSFQDGDSTSRDGDPPVDGHDPAPGGCAPAGDRGDANDDRRTDHVDRSARRLDRTDSGGDQGTVVADDVDGGSSGVEGEASGREADDAGSGERTAGVAEPHPSIDDALPADVDGEELVAAVADACTLYDVQQALDLDRARTQSMLTEVGLLDLVHGRMATMPERDERRAEIERRLRERADVSSPRR